MNVASGRLIRLRDSPIGEDWPPYHRDKLHAVLTVLSPVHYFLNLLLQFFFLTRFCASSFYSSLISFQCFFSPFTTRFVESSVYTIRNVLALWLLTPFRYVNSSFSIVIFPSLSVFNCRGFFRILRDFGSLRHHLIAYIFMRPRRIKFSICWLSLICEIGASKLLSISFR